MNRTPLKRRRSKTVDDYARELDALTPALMERADWQCEVRIPGVCIGRPLTRHHRIPRSVGGLNLPENIIVCCGSGTTGCHGWIEHHVVESHDYGLLVWSWEDVESIPARGWR